MDTTVKMTIDAENYDTRYVVNDLYGLYTAKLDAFAPKKLIIGVALTMTLYIIAVIIVAINLPFENYEWFLMISLIILIFGETKFLNMDKRVNCYILVTSYDINNTIQSLETREKNGEISILWKYEKITNDNERLASIIFSNDKKASKEFSIIRAFNNKDKYLKRIFNRKGDYATQPYKVCKLKSDWTVELNQLRLIDVIDNYCFNNNTVCVSHKALFSNKIPLISKFKNTVSHCLWGMYFIVIFINMSTDIFDSIPGAIIYLILLFTFLILANVIPYEIRDRLGFTLFKISYSDKKYNELYNSEEIDDGRIILKKDNENSYIYIKNFKYDKDITFEYVSKYKRFEKLFQIFFKEKDIIDYLNKVFEKNGEDIVTFRENFYTGFDIIF